MDLEISILNEVSQTKTNMILSILWTARRPNQSTLKEINPGYSWDGLLMKLKLQYFGHLM